MSPMILNIVVDAVVRAWLTEICSLEVTNQGLGYAVGERGASFYTTDGRILGDDAE